MRRSVFQLLLGLVAQTALAGMWVTVQQLDQLTTLRNQPDGRYAVNRLLVLMLLVAFGSSASAGTRVTVRDAEQLLQSLRDKPDGKVAERIASLELTERASSLRLSQWQAELPGMQTREALLALADASAFLDLPSEDIPKMPMPEASEQQKILSRTVEYVKTTIHKLPNFSARRSTTHFEDLPKPGNSTLWGSLENPVDGPRLLRVLDRSSTVVTYLDGLDVVDAEDKTNAGVRKGKKSHSPGMRLTSSGEFGPILSVVIGDAIHGQVRWGHWEQGAAGPTAVLLYAVPEANSHYAVALAKIGDEGKSQNPAYHGEIAVDPADGSILRLTIVSELNEPRKTFKSIIVVEYGPVTIGDRLYICPTRSEALSKLTESSTEADGVAHVRFLTYLNDVSFTDYHVFRAEVRVLP